MFFSGARMAVTFGLARSQPPPYLAAPFIDVGHQQRSNNEQDTSDDEPFKEARRQLKERFPAFHRPVVGGLRIGGGVVHTGHSNRGRHAGHNFATIGRSYGLSCRAAT